MNMMSLYCILKLEFCSVHKTGDFVVYTGIIFNKKLLKLFSL